LSAITTRLQALTILVATDFVKRDAVMEEIASRATTLEAFYQRIQNGFTQPRTPRFFPDIQYQNLAIPPDPPLLVSLWDQSNPAIVTNRVVGIVDAYVGDGVLSSYPVNLFPNRLVGPFLPTGDPPPREYSDFVTRYRLATAKRLKNLYLLIGLDQVWSEIQNLKGLTGQTVEPFDGHLYWSLRDVVDDLNADGLPPPPDDLSLFDAVQRLARIGAVDNSHVFLVSWREALEACVV
jgi:hypothetical protein